MNHLYYKLLPDMKWETCDREEFLAQSGQFPAWRKKDIIDGKVVSTVFLGINHGHLNDFPLLFETMVFPKEGNFSEMWGNRSTFYEDALVHHAEAIEWVKKGCRCYLPKGFETNEWHTKEDSDNGNTSDSKSENLGSIPSPSAN